jgi:uncharacterized HAD superfamily protein
MNQVSVDFDGTLSRKDVQIYIATLIARNIKVFVITSRFKKRNQDLYKVTNKLKIPKDQIIMTERKPKVYFINKLNLVWHLDDNDYELSEIANNSNCKAIDVKSQKWLSFCEKLLK